MEYVRESLGMVNKHIGYVYLLDEELKVRWAGCGDAKPEETDALRTSAGVLLKRIKVLNMLKKGKALTSKKRTPLEL
jgi:ATPase complex subunit ATP10